MPNSVADLENFVFVSFAFFVVQVFEDAIEDVVLEAPAVEGEVPLGQGLLEAQIAIGMEGAHWALKKKRPNKKIFFISLTWAEI